MGKQIRCCNCNKVIANEASIQSGFISITCKCGTVNEIKASPKERVTYDTKELDAAAPTIPLSPDEMMDGGAEYYRQQRRQQSWFSGILK